MPSFPLRLPTETLAGCVFLPRFLDKVRAHAAGTLTDDYLFVFGHPRGMDGHFFGHFGFTKETIVPALTPLDDEAAATWFLAQPGVTPESIAAWNAHAPNIGRVGHPGHRELQWMLKKIFGESPVPAQIQSSFTAILWEERPETRSA